MAKSSSRGCAWGVVVVLAWSVSASGQVREYLASPAGQAESAASREVLNYIAAQTDLLQAAEPGRYCGTALGQYVFEHRHDLGPEARTAVAAAWPGLLARPLLDSTFDVPGAPIRIHYNIAGPDSVRNATSDTAADGVPTYVHVAAESLRRAYDLLVDTMSFAPPVGDGAAGGGTDLYDCYLAHPGGQAFVIAFTTEETTYIRTVGSENVRYATSYQVVHPTMEPFPQLANRLDLLRITCAHELFHAIHFNIDKDEKPSVWQVNGWWLEGTSTWFEDRAYTDINDWSNLPAYMFRPERSIAYSQTSSDLHPYGGGSLWTFYLWERFGGDQIIHDIWERCGLVSGDNTLAATSAELASRSYTLDQAWRQFAGWCMRTGTHWDDSSFSQGADWPEPVPLRKFSRYPSLLHLTDGQDTLRRLVDAGIPESTFSAATVALGSLGFLPISYVPFATNSGAMNFFVAGATPLPVSFFYTGTDKSLFPPAEVERDVPSYATVPIPERFGFNAMAMVAVAGVHFDSGTQLSSVTPVLIAALDTSSAASGLVTLSPPHPNPVRVEDGEAAHFDLVLTSPEDVYLDIFSVGGDRVRSLVVENAVGGVSLFWDGTNDSGRRVAAGLYLCKLKAGTAEEVFRVGVLR